MLLAGVEAPDDRDQVGSVGPRYAFSAAGATGGGRDTGGARKGPGHRPGWAHSERWIGVGSAVAGIGATAAGGYWIYTLQASPHVSFWRLPGYISLSVLLIGCIFLVAGFFWPQSGSE